MKTLTRVSWFGPQSVALLTTEERTSLPLVAQTRRDPQYCGFGWSGWSTVTALKGYFGVPQSDRSVLVYFSPSIVGRGEVTTGYGGSSGPSVSQLEGAVLLGGMARAEQSVVISREEFDCLPIVYRDGFASPPPPDGVTEGSTFRVVAKHEEKQPWRYQIWKVGAGGQPEFLGNAVVLEGEVKEYDLS